MDLPILTQHQPTITTGIHLEGKPADFILRSLLASGRVGDAVRAVASADSVGAAEEGEEGEGNSSNELLAGASDVCVDLT